MLDISSFPSDAIKRQKHPEGCFDNFPKEVARLTGLEPATPGVTGRYSNHLSYNRTLCVGPVSEAVVARLTGLEPATPGVTGRYSNHLSYNRSLPPDRIGRGVRGLLGLGPGAVKQISQPFCS